MVLAVDEDASGPGQGSAVACAVDQDAALAGGSAGWGGEKCAEHFDAGVCTGLVGFNAGLGVGTGAGQHCQCQGLQVMGPKPDLATGLAGNLTQLGEELSDH